MKYKSYLLESEELRIQMMKSMNLTHTGFNNYKDIQGNVYHWNVNKFDKNSGEQEEKKIGKLLSSEEPGYKNKRVKAIKKYGEYFLYVTQDDDDHDFSDVYFMLPNDILFRVGRKLDVDNEKSLNSLPKEYNKEAELIKNSVFNSTHGFYLNKNLWQALNLPLDVLETRHKNLRDEREKKKIEDEKNYKEKEEKEKLETEQKETKLFNELKERLSKEKSDISGKDLIFLADKLNIEYPFQSKNKIINNISKVGNDTIDGRYRIALSGKYNSQHPFDILDKVKEKLKTL